MEQLTFDDYVIDSAPAIRRHRSRLRVDESGRQCGTCGEYKPWDDFHLSRTTIYGHVTTCKPCKALKSASRVRPRAVPNTVGKLCECGCGQPTSLAGRTDPRIGWIKGRPVRFIRGHQRRGKRKAAPAESRRGKLITHNRAYREAGYKHAPGRNLKSMYGITFRQYSGMLVAQCGMCAICGALPGADPDAHRKSSRLVVDHDHKTGRVRGLLCHRCNLMLGQSGDDPARLLDGAKYLLDTLPQGDRHEPALSLR
jgi:hypothetical protein